MLLKNTNVKRLFFVMLLLGCSSSVKAQEDGAFTEEIESDVISDSSTGLGTGLKPYSLPTPTKKKDPASLPEEKLQSDSSSRRSEQGTTYTHEPMSKKKLLQMGIAGLCTTLLGFAWYTIMQKDIQEKNKFKGKVLNADSLHKKLAKKILKTDRILGVLTGCGAGVFLATLIS